jgi:hypothetical protein
MTDTNQPPRANAGQKCILQFAARNNCALWGICIPRPEMIRYDL